MTDVTNTVNVRHFFQNDDVENLSAYAVRVEHDQTDPAWNHVEATLSITDKDGGSVYFDLSVMSMSNGSFRSEVGANLDALYGLRGAVNKMIHALENIDASVATARALQAQALLGQAPQHAECPESV